jgi:uncharacterized protein YbaP (TraB family)
MRALPALCLAMTLLAGAAQLRAEPVPSQAEPVVAEIDVVGERPGPRMWRVSKGDHVLWVLGTLQPLPRKMTWKSNTVAQVLDESQELLTGGFSVSADIGPITAIRLYLQWRRVQKNEDKSTLKQTLPPALYARFSALQAKYAPHDSRMQTLRPMFAAARLYTTALEASGLTSANDIQQTILKLAKKRNVAIQQIKLEIVDPKGLLKTVGETPRAAELICVETAVARLETDLDTMKARARAWAEGDVEGLRHIPYADDTACRSAITNAPRIKELSDRARNSWLEAAYAALAKNRITLALQTMDRLLGPDGLLAQFRARGYSVEGP